MYVVTYVVNGTTGRINFIDVVILFSPAGNRMLEHYMRKEGIMEGSGSKVTVSPSMAVRLGAVPVAGNILLTHIN